MTSGWQIFPRGFEFDSGWPQSVELPFEAIERGKKLDLLNRRHRLRHWNLRYSWVGCNHVIFCHLSLIFPYRRQDTRIVFSYYYKKTLRLSDNVPGVPTKHWQCLISTNIKTIIATPRVLSIHDNEKDCRLSLLPQSFANRRLRNRL